VRNRSENTSDLTLFFQYLTVFYYCFLSIFLIFTFFLFVFLFVFFFFSRGADEAKLREKRAELAGSEDGDSGSEGGTSPPKRVLHAGVGCLFVFFFSFLFFQMCRKSNFIVSRYSCHMRAGSDFL
jgi:hypothetical protein